MPSRDGDDQENDSAGKKFPDAGQRTKGKVLCDTSSGEDRR